MADITGARVIAGEGSVGYKKDWETGGKMKYPMKNSDDIFKLFRRGESPEDLGHDIDLGPMLERAKTMPVERMESIAPSLERAPADRTPVGR